MNEIVPKHSDQSWSRSGASDYATPQFNFLPASLRLQLLWTYGSIAAIHIQTILTGPDPISPFFIYAVIMGDVSAWDDLDYNYIRSLDPTVAATLKPWFDVTDTTIFSPNDFDCDVSRLLIAYCAGSVQVSQTPDNEPFSCSSSQSDIRTPVSARGGCSKKS